MVAGGENLDKCCCKNGRTLRVSYRVGGPVPKKYVVVDRCVMNNNFLLLLKSVKVIVKTRNLHQDFLITNALTQVQIP